MLTSEETQRIEAYSVWRERQRYSDSQLWERLTDFYNREIEILRTLPLAYSLAYGDVPDYELWRSYWRRLILELDANEPVMKAIVWHLTRRGDPAISGWLAECEQYKRDNAVKWQKAAWGIEDE